MLRLPAPWLFWLGAGRRARTADRTSQARLRWNVTRSCLRNFRRLRKSRIRSAGVFALRTCGRELGSNEGIILFNFVLLRAYCQTPRLLPSGGGESGSARAGLARASAVRPPPPLSDCGHKPSPHLLDPKGPSLGPESDLPCSNAINTRIVSATAPVCDFGVVLAHLVSPFVRA